MVILVTAVRERLVELLRAAIEFVPGIDEFDDCDEWVEEAKALLEELNRK